MHFYVILKSLPISDDRGPSSFEGTSTVLRLKFMYVSSFDSINMRVMSKGEYVMVPKGTKFTGSGKLGLSVIYALKVKLVAVPKLYISYTVEKWQSLIQVINDIVIMLFSCLTVLSCLQ